MAEPSQRKRTAEAQSDPFIFLVLRPQDGDEAIYKFHINKPIRYLFTKYCTRKGLEYPALRFLHENGERINTTKTPAELGLEEGDVIDVMGIQTGGDSHGRSGR